MTGRETIGSRLAQLRREKAARERRDIPQTLASEELGASAAAYSRWESDLRKPNEAWLVQLARYFGTSVPFIHYGVPDVQKPASVETGRFSAEKWKDVTAQAEAALAAEEEAPASTTARRKNGGRKR